MKRPKIVLVTTALALLLAGPAAEARSTSSNAATATASATPCGTLPRRGDRSPRAGRKRGPHLQPQGRGLMSTGA